MFGSVEGAVGGATKVVRYWPTQGPSAPRSTAAPKPRCRATPPPTPCAGLVRNKEGGGTQHLEPVSSAAVFTSYTCGRRRPLRRPVLHVYSGRDLSGNCIQVQKFLSFSKSLELC